MHWIGDDRLLRSGLIIDLPGWQADLQYASNCDSTTTLPYLAAQRAANSIKEDST